MINISVAELFKQLNRYFYKKEGIFLLLILFFMTLFAHSIYKNGFLSFIKDNSFVSTLIILLGGLGSSYTVIALLSGIKKITCLACNNKKERKKLSLLLNQLDNDEKGILRKLCDGPKSISQYEKGISSLTKYIEVIHYGDNMHVYQINSLYMNTIKKYFDNH